MLNKSYVATGCFPYEGKTTQLTICKETGQPVKLKTPRKKDGKTRVIRHGLQGAVCFYAVTTTIKGLLVTISDASQTRYYWNVDGVNADTYMVNKPSRTFEQGWLNLFEALIGDVTKKSLSLYNKISFIFPDMLKDYQKTIGHAYHRNFKVMWKGKVYEASLQMGDRIGPMAIRVTAFIEVGLNSSGGPFVDLPLNTHPIHVMFSNIRFKKE